MSMWKSPMGGRVGWLVALDVGQAGDAVAPQAAMQR
jgi:hypothetical protein